MLIGSKTKRVIFLPLIKIYAVGSWKSTIMRKKLMCFVFYIILIASLIYFDLVDQRPVRTFINLPFEEEASQFETFVLWKKHHGDSYDIIYLKFG